MWPTGRLWTRKWYCVRVLLAVEILSPPRQSAQSGSRPRQRFPIISEPLPNTYSSGLFTVHYSTENNWTVEPSRPISRHRATISQAVVPQGPSTPDMIAQALLGHRPATDRPDYRPSLPFRGPTNPGPSCGARALTSLPTQPSSAPVQIRSLSPARSFSFHH